jgi:hypothetical protein
MYSLIIWPYCDPSLVCSARRRSPAARKEGSTRIGSGVKIDRTIAGPKREGGKRTGEVNKVVVVDEVGALGALA